MGSADDVRVDFLAMRAAGVRIGHAADDARDAFDRDNGELEATLVGWTGASQAALSAVTARWRATGDSLIDAVDDHVLGISEAAATFEREESMASERFLRIGDAGARESSILNLD